MPTTQAIDQGTVDLAAEEGREDRSVLQEPRSNQGPKVLLLDFDLPIT